MSNTFQTLSQIHWQAIKLFIALTLLYEKPTHHNENTNNFHQRPKIFYVPLQGKHRQDSKKADRQADMQVQVGRQADRKVNR